MDRVDARELRKRELEALVAMRKTEVKEVFVESVPEAGKLQRSSSATDNSIKSQPKVSWSLANKQQERTKSPEKSFKTAENIHEKTKSIGKSAIKNMFKTVPVENTIEVKPSLEEGSRKDKMLKAFESVSIKKPIKEDITEKETQSQAHTSLETNQISNLIKSKSTELSETSKAATAKISKASNEMKSEIKAKVSKVLEKQNESNSQISKDVVSSYKKIVKTAKERLTSPERKDDENIEEKKAQTNEELSGERES